MKTMTKTTRWALLMAGLLLSTATCKSEKQSQLVVGIATDLNAPAPLSRVRLQVFKLDSTGNVVNGGIAFPDETFDISGSLDRPHELPGSYVLLSDGEPRVKVVVTGQTAGGREMVRRTAILQLSAGETRFLRMGVVGACVDNSDCGEGKTCIEGVCQDARVDAKALPLYRTDMEKTFTCSSGTSFVSTSRRTAAPMTGSGSCAADEYCVEGTCRKAALSDSTDWQAEVAHAICTQNIRCGLAQDQRTCVAAYLSQPARQQWFSNLVEGVRISRIKFDSTVARRCFDNFRNGACERSRAEPLKKEWDCYAAFKGTLANGSACVENEECSSAGCAKGCTQACCMGVCSSPAAAGGACRAIRECQAGLNCSSSSCRAAGPLGSTCQTDFDCAQGACAQGTCRAPGTTGAACVTQQDCDNVGDVCAGGLCTRLGGVNAPCNPAAPTCAPFTRCVGTGTTGTCQVLAKLNEPCTTDADCQAGTCMLAGTSGGSSPPDGGVATGRVCRVAAITVRPCLGGGGGLPTRDGGVPTLDRSIGTRDATVVAGPGMVGSPCTLNGDCMLPFVCNRNICTDPRSRGQDAGPIRPVDAAAPPDAAVRPDTAIPDAALPDAAAPDVAADLPAENG